MDGVSLAAKESPEHTNPKWATFLISVVALFAPAAIQTYVFTPNQMKIIAMLWIYNIGYTGTPYVTDPRMWLITFTLTFLRLAFVVMIYRLYQGKTTSKRCSIVGIASESQVPLSIIIPTLLTISSYPGLDYIPVVIPIPILILSGAIMVRILKLPDTRQWIEKEQSQSWWKKPEVDTVSPPLAEEDDAQETQKEFGWLEDNPH
ncbi:MAG: hypothetical protein P1Q69_06345 [Candidatus Thorarchaeota archaeon]|nr:hypothetical protein [Candidatus Thorarchaeota archaeon]